MILASLCVDCDRRRNTNEPKCSLVAQLEALQASGTSSTKFFKAETTSAKGTITIAVDDFGGDIWCHMAVHRRVPTKAGNNKQKVLHVGDYRKNGLFLSQRFCPKVYKRYWWYPKTHSEMQLAPKN